MDRSTFIWEWLNGLVRRAAIGVLLFFLFSVTSVLLFLAALERDSGLENLGAYSQLHSHFTDAFLDIADHATELTGSRSRAAALSAVEPLRQSLIAGEKETPGHYSCAASWIEGLRDFQSLPGQIAASCKMVGDSCVVSHDRLLLIDLVAFERGIASVQDLLQALDHDCSLGPTKTAYCDYFRAHKDNEIQAVGTFVGSHYREALPKEDNALLGARKQRSACSADRGFLAAHGRLVTVIDPTARPRTLADFERLGDTISASRVAIQSADTRLSSAPAGGLFTVLIPKDVSFPILHFLGLVALLYAFLHVRRLSHLSASSEIGDERALYRLYPYASHNFTAPVFGGSAGTDASTQRISKISRTLTSWMFDWIPVIALCASLVGVAGATTLWLAGSGEFSLAGIAVSYLFAALQIVVTLAYRAEQRRVMASFARWIGEPGPSSPNPSEGEGQ